MSETAIIKFDPEAIPESFRNKLLTMLRGHYIKAIDLARMKFWLESNPAAPEDQWHTVFGTFILVGNGREITDIQLSPTGVKLIPPDQENPADDIITALESQSVWTPKELAEFFKCSLPEINKLGRQGRLPSYPITSNMRRYCGPTLADKLAEIEQGGKKPPRKK